MADRLTYEEFSEVADKLFYEEMVMPTAEKTLKVLQHGSKSTHQLYLGRWKEERKKKPSTIEESLELKAVHKYKEFLSDAWKILKQASDQKINTIKQESEKVVQEAQTSVTILTNERDELIKEFTKKKEELATFQSETQLLKNKLIHEEKLKYALEESSHALKKQLNDNKTSTEQQIAFIKQQYEKSESLLKDQLKESTLKHVDEIEQLEHDKRNEVQELNAHVNKLKEIIHSTELQLQDKNAKLDKYLSNYNKVIQQNEALQNQLKIQDNQFDALKKQNNDFEIQIIKKDSEIGHLKELATDYKNKITLYEKELKEHSIQIGALQEKLSAQTAKADKNPRKRNKSE